MLERLLVESEEFKGMWVGVLTRDVQITDTRWLAQEFAPLRADSFRSALQALLEVNGNQVASSPEIFQKGGEIFRLENRDYGVIAVAMSKYYSWDLLKNQICFQCHRSHDGQIEALSLNTFGGLVRKRLGEDCFSIAVELAYNLIDARYRGQGLGSKMFALRIARARDIITNGPKLLFTMSRGAYLVEKTVNEILSYMVENERRLNGERPDGRAIITGLRVSVSEINRRLCLPTHFIFGKVHTDSQPIVSLAKKAEMSEIGLFKDLSPIFTAPLYSLMPDFA